jgi:class 3 adenylate cyclase/tetratricopeptide (TPR) repeat protein
LRVTENRNVTTQKGSAEQTVQVKLLGPFSVTSGGRTAGPWPRPSARRLCELVLVSPGHRVSRDLVCEELFPGLDPRAAARSVSKALSMARAALCGLGPHGDSLLIADLTHVWASQSAQVDAEAQETALRAALSMAAGQDRDDRFVAALAEEAELLADEPYADWALRPRERLEALRQEARLTLARDRSKGAGRSRPEAVVQAWESCFENDPASEEAAGALVRAYFGQGRRELGVRTYERCRTALEQLGLRVSPSLEEVYFEATASPAPAPAAMRAEMREELRTVSVLFAEVAAPAGLARKLGLEGLRDVVAGSLAAVIAEVEELGGTVTSVSGGGLQAMFGAPQAHEDDPERAVRAAFRAMAAVAVNERPTQTPTLRIGVETGQALLGPIGGGTRVEYGAVGEVVAAAAALQSSARPGSVLVGPVTRAATSHLFTWGTSERIHGADPLVASYLGHPRAMATGRRLRSRIPLAGRQPELAVLGAAVRAATCGHGSLVVLTGDPGLGKTRLVQECRKRFMAWAGSANGTLPRWLEGRCASYASATPYGLYRQLVASWVGVAADQPEKALRPALGRALVAATGREDLLPVLACMMGLSPGAALGRMSPEELQRATFTACYSLISRLVTAGPTVLVLEDLHWADPTSIHLTLHLARLAAGRPLLILATTRPDRGSEPARDGLASYGLASYGLASYGLASYGLASYGLASYGLASYGLARDGLARDERPGCPVHRILLKPLPREAERELAQSLIGEAASAEVLDTVLTGVEGNPLFMEERLSSLLEAGGLVRSQAGWQVGAEADPGVPQVLERLVHSRVDRLSPTARDTVRAASVLGAEFSLSLLTAVCAADEPLEPAVAELCAADLVRQVASRPDPAFRFRHALIQEGTYDGLLRAERRLLHGRGRLGARNSVARPPGRSRGGARAALAAAGEGERALEYLELAGDHATAVFANDEAVSVFRAALAVMREQYAGSQATAAGLHAKLANVLWRTARRAAAKEAFQQALRNTGTKDVLRRAHLLTRLGRLEMVDGRDAAATEAFDAAEALLGTNPMEEDDATVEAWLELMVDGRAGLYTQRNEPDLALATLRTVQPVLEARGTPTRTYGFYQVVALRRVLQNRYRVDEVDIANMRKAVAAAAQGDDEKDLGYATFFLGRLLLLRGDLAAAREQLEKSLALAERIGESQLLAQSLLSLTVTALRRGDIAAVRSLAPRAMTAASAMAGAGAQTGVKACLAWLAWHDQRPEDVVTLAKQITGQQAAAGRFAVFYAWAYLWPLVAVHLKTGDAGPGP